MSRLRMLYMALLCAACGSSAAEPCDENAGATDADGGIQTPDAPQDAPDSQPQAPITPQRSMLILTTSQIATDSSKLDDFVEAKRARGMHVVVATEEDYGGEDEQGRDRAVRVHEWLKTRYREFGYLLLIGDPSTQYGDMPMLKVHPVDNLDQSCGGIDCETSGTDAYYADPLGDWDLNGNGEYGEYGIDDGPGGVDFEPELAVGRIPVYFGDTEELDRTLEKTLGYMNADPSEIGYRRSVLMAKSVVFIEGQRFFPNHPRIEETIDTAVPSEWFIRNYLPPERGVKVTRMYEQDGIAPSTFPSDLALTQEAFLEEWKRGHGMVWWGGHGSPRSVVRTTWTSDVNGDQLPDGEVGSPPLIDSSEVDRLEGTPGGFVVATSCLVGRIEVPDALSYKLLRHGAAVGVVASSAPASVDEKSFEDMGPELDRSVFDIDYLAVMVLDGLLSGEPAGRIVGDSRLILGEANSELSYQAKLMLNYYGDPSLTLYDTIADIR